MKKPITPVLRPLKAIRANCLDCCCGKPSEVRACSLKTCPVWGYRMGHRPSPADVKAVTAALENLHSRKETGAKI
ncbi:MAG: hypothetical protein WC340_04365 [Kiritimatiellia bacterium]